MPVKSELGISKHSVKIQMREGSSMIADLRGKGGRIGEGWAGWMLWSVVEQAAKQTPIERIGVHDPLPLRCAA